MRSTLVGRRLHAVHPLARVQTFALDHWPLAVLAAIIFGRALWKLATLIVASRGGAQ